MAELRQKSSTLSMYRWLAQSKSLQNSDPLPMVSALPWERGSTLYGAEVTEKDVSTEKFDSPKLSLQL
jgi:hypothetical protein